MLANEYELCGWLVAFLKNWLPALASGIGYELWLATGVPEASRIGYELCGWLMTFLRKLAICAGELN